MADLSQLLYGGQQAPQEAPQGVRTPWQGLPPARADQMKQRAYEQAQKYLQDNASVVSTGSDVLNQLEQFNALNQQSRTGEFYSGLLPDFAVGRDEGVMQSITADLAPKKRVAGSGTTSDKDIALYLQSLPSVQKKGSVNQAIIENYRKQYEKANAKLNFMQGYFDQYGHLNGAESLWEKEKNKYIKSPITGTTSNIINEADAIIKGR